MFVQSGLKRTTNFEDVEICVVRHALTCLDLANPGFGFLQGSEIVRRRDQGGRPVCRHTDDGKACHAFRDISLAP